MLACPCQPREGGAPSQSHPHGHWFFLPGQKRRFDVAQTSRNSRNVKKLCSFCFSVPAQAPASSSGGAREPPRPLLKARASTGNGTKTTSLWPSQ